MIARHLLNAVWLAGSLGAATPLPAPETGPDAAQNQPALRAPLVTPAPDRADWTVRMIRDFGGSWEFGGKWGKNVPASTTTRMIRAVEVSKDATAKICRLRTLWSDGESEDEWIVQGQRLAARPGGRGFYIAAGESSAGPDLGGTDFPELGWLKPSHYRGVATYKGGKVLRFAVPFDEKPLSETEAQLFRWAKQREPGLTPTQHFKPKAGEVVVYLDAVTQLPVLYNDGTTIRTYTFRPLSGEKLAPTPDIVKFLEQRKKELESKLTPPPGP